MPEFELRIPEEGLIARDTFTGNGGGGGTGYVSSASSMSRSTTPVR